MKPMQPLKIAAVVAGSMMAMGAAAPAFAAEALPTSLNGGLGGALETVTNQETLQADVVNTNALDPNNNGSLVNSVSDVAKGLGGGAKGGKSGKGAKGGKGGAMLGGIPLGEIPLGR
ncbi:hypothetical protein OG875_18290 [Streptomyces sp. NBC_01498]|uniref:hypothetical protein n=1 Tax=Streptomyces sp. NBC_01498 TaxID=2975870 RepID=UPI002E7BAB9D|nr:hypothetical protein [Streptomyces sp. NBC_01498]WTL26362.1 hypothetical protein OG875_18290 [Streptomyces sp. NBC_01498]